MQIKAFKNQIKDLLILNKDMLRTMEPRRDVLDANIKYWLKSEELIRLKNGFYILGEKYQKETDKDSYLEYLSERILSPSYLSLEYVLAKFQLLSEPVRSLTLVTTQTTREIINDLGSFRYYSISPKLFTGYRVKYFSGAPVWEASKSKALFDFLYLRFLKKERISAKSISGLRINWENITNSEFADACAYLKFTPSRRLNEVFKIIKGRYYA